MKIVQQLYSITDIAAWQSVLPANTSVFGSVEYARIYQSHTGYLARLFVVNSDDFQVAYPFFLRPVNALPFVSKMPELFWDTITPEYTGPIVCHSNNLTSTMDFTSAFSSYCQKEGIVTEFAHLNPWQEWTNLLDVTSVKFDREIVYVDLSLSEEQLWQDSFTYACRKNIKRAQREKIRVFCATTSGDIEEFYKIYTQTMEYNGALEKYFFPLDYFMAFFEQMPNNARFVLAAYNDLIIAGTLYLHDNLNIYSYLGGADRAFQQLRPSNAIIYETIRWGQQQGKQRLVLGGGYKPDDGIYRFKSSFSPLRVNFQIYRYVHLPEVYSHLCKGWTQHNHSDIDQSGYFPAYRAKV